MMKLYASTWMNKCRRFFVTSSWGLLDSSHLSHLICGALDCSFFVSLRMCQIGFRAGASLYVSFPNTISLNRLIRIRHNPISRVFLFLSRSVSPMRSAKMFFVFLLIQLISLSYTARIPSPVIVQIESDSTKSFHLGPYDRTRFDLVEQFHPLQTASVAKGGKKQELQTKFQGLNTVQHQRTEPTNQLAIVPVHYGNKEENTASLTQRLIFGEWMEWSAWTPCLHGERNRVRTCLPRRPASHVVCHGIAKEKQHCFSSKEHHVAVAKDPWTIEREISGDFKT